jgi:hypothetical protein
MNFCPGSKNSIIGKTPRKPEDMTELSTKHKSPSNLFVLLGYLFSKL